MDNLPLPLLKQIIVYVLYTDRTTPGFLRRATALILTIIPPELLGVMPRGLFIRSWHNFIGKRRHIPGFRQILIDCVHDILESSRGVNIKCIGDTFYVNLIEELCKHHPGDVKINYFDRPTIKFRTIQLVTSITVNVPGGLHSARPTDYSLRQQIASPGGSVSVCWTIYHDVIVENMHGDASFVGRKFTPSGFIRHYIYLESVARYKLLSRNMYRINHPEDQTFDYIIRMSYLFAKTPIDKLEDLSTYILSKNNKTYKMSECDILKPREHCYYTISRSHIPG